MVVADDQAGPTVQASDDVTASPSERESEVSSIQVTESVEVSDELPREKEPTRPGEVSRSGTTVANADGASVTKERASAKKRTQPTAVEDKLKTNAVHANATGKSALRCFGLALHI